MTNANTRIKNQPNEKPYGEIVLTGDNGEVLYDIVYDGKGYHNYLEHLKNYYNMQIKETK